MFIYCSIFTFSDWKPEDQYTMEAYNRKKSEILRSEQTDYKIALKPFDTADYAVCAELLLAVMNSILQRVQAKIPEGARGHIAILFTQRDAYFTISGAGGVMND